MNLYSCEPRSQARCMTPVRGDQLCPIPSFSILVAWLQSLLEIASKGIGMLSA